MEALADEVNSRTFAFNISKNYFDGNEEFMLDESLAASSFNHSGGSATSGNGQRAKG